jgi:hypothetical protein
MFFTKVKSSLRALPPSLLVRYLGGEKGEKEGGREREREREGGKEREREREREGGRESEGRKKEGNGVVKGEGGERSYTDLIMVCIALSIFASLPIPAAVAL